MTITTSQIIEVNTGSFANDGTGDDLRTAFTKVNETFANIITVGFDTGNIYAAGEIQIVGNATAGNVTATNLTGNITTPAQPAITSVGTLTGVTSSGIVHITNATPSTVFNNGALVIDGGLGVNGDIRISGNMYVGNTVQTSVTTLVTTSPLVYFDTIPAYPYNFDLGFYGRFTGGVGNVEQHTGFVRNDADSKWYLFSNVTIPTLPTVVTTQIAMTGASAKYDTLVLGNIELKSTATTAITNGGTTATGNIGASGATFNYGYFTNLTGTLQTAAQPNITSASTLATVGTITSGTWSGLFGAVSGANLTVLTAGNLIGTISSTVMGNSTVYIGTTAIALNRTTAIQSLSGISIDGAAGSVAASAITGTTLPATLITSSLTTLGTLTGLAATGVIRTTGIVYANAATASTSSSTGALVVAGGIGISGDVWIGGNIHVANATTTLIGDLVGDVTGNLTGNVIGNVTGNVTGTHTGAVIGNVTGNVIGNLTGNAGTATTLQTSRNINGVAFNGSADITVTAAAGTLTGTTLNSTVINSSLTSVGTLISLAVTGNVTTGNVSGTNLTGNLTGTILTASQPNITTLAGVTSIGASGATTLTGILQTAAQTNVTSLGTLTGLTVSGTIAANANNTINIGAAGTVFATVFATTFSGVSTTAKYADLAENYLSDSNYAAGTVVVFGGAQEITTTTLFADATVAGVISTNPAYLMNDALDGQPVALRGRVPVQVQGFTRKGDLLVTSSIAGVAVSVGRDAGYGIAVFAKALENKTTTEIGIIEAVII